MYQKHDWVIFHHPYTIKLTPSVTMIINRGEKGEVVDIEDNEYWIKLHHRNIIIAINEDIIDDYINEIDYSKN